VSKISDLERQVQEISRNQQQLNAAVKLKEQRLLKLDEASIEEMLEETRAAIAKVPLTPLSRSKGTRDLIVRAKEYEQSSDFRSAILIYNQALTLCKQGGLTALISKLEKKIEALEKETTLVQKTAVLNFEPLLKTADGSSQDGNFEPEPNNNSSGNHTGVDGSNSSGGAITNTSPNSDIGSVVPKKKRKKSPPLPTPVPTAADAARLLSILNSGTLKEILNLWEIGQGRASKILERRMKSPLQSVDELKECGFGARAFDAFLRKNLTTPST